MIKILRSISIAIILSFFTQTTHSQEIPPPPVEWGKISIADLAMTTFPGDTNASAVILCDYGETKLNDNFDLDFNRHLRVKILNQKGFRWGTHSVTLFSDKDNGETIDDIEGVTYVLSDNDKIQTHEFDEDDLFEEKINSDHTRYKFTLPGLTPGCVIEIRYTITSKSLFGIRDWVFQEDEPVLWSEYRLIHPTPIAFAVLTRGYEKFAISDKIEIKQYYSGEVSSYYSQQLVNCYFWRWAMKDIPALREEPFITTLDDYYSKVDLQLSAYALRYGGVERVLNTWEKLVEDLHNSKYIGKFVKTSADVEDAVNIITKDISSPLEKMRAIYHWVSSSIVWSGQPTIWSDQEVDDILESKKGNSADINYLMVSMLRAAEIESDPIILSTRGNGVLQEIYPLTKQFNYGMARAVISGKQYILDATDPSRPLELLPSKVLGVRALVIQPDKVEWLTLSSLVKSATVILANIVLDSNGIVRGTIDGTFKDYANINARNSLKEKKPTEVAKDFFLLDASGITLDSVQVINQDSIIKSVILKAWVSSETYAQSSNDYLYVNPHMVNRWNDNPFKSQKRKFPVDYNYPREYLTIVNLTIPDTFEIKEGLTNKRFSLGGDVVYSRQMQVDGQRIQIMSKFEIINKVIESRNYEKLKELYASMIQSESEQIVLHKKPPPLIVPPVQQTEKPEERKPAMLPKKKK